MSASAPGSLPLRGGITEAVLHCAAELRSAARPISARQLRRLRAAVCAAAAVLVLAAVLIAVFASASPRAEPASAEEQTVPTRTVVVGEDANLWTIVRTGGYDRDPRGVIEDIQRFNGLSSSVVHPGQELTVPAR